MDSKRRPEHDTHSTNEHRKKWFPYVVKDNLELLCPPFLPSLCIARDGTQSFMYVRQTLYQLSYSPSPRHDFLHKLF